MSTAGVNDRGGMEGDEEEGGREGGGSQTRHVEPQESAAGAEKATVAT